MRTAVHKLKSLGSRYKLRNKTLQFVLRMNRYPYDPDMAERIYNEYIQWLAKYIKTYIPKHSQQEVIATTTLVIYDLDISINGLVNKYMMNCYGIGDLHDLVNKFQEECDV